jgi:hypothetical protein
MDEKKEEQDLVINADGAINQGNDSIDIKTDDTSSEPELNEITPPEEDQTTDTTKEDDTSVESAVSFIAGANEGSSENAEESSDSDKIEVKTESTSDESVTPIVLEAPNNASPEEIVVEENTDSTDVVESNEGIIKPSNENDLNSSDNKVDNNMSNNEKSQNHEHRNNKKLAVIVTIFVAILLTATVIYLFISAQDNTVQTTSNDAELSNTAPTELAPANSEEIDQTINEIDQTINTLDDSPLDDSTVTDESLGLQ